MSAIPQNIVIRESVSGDAVQLIALWHDVFGDSPELVEAFLSLLPEMGSGCVAERSGQILAAAYLVHGFTLSCPGLPPRRCGYLYAVATDRSARNCCLGTAVSRGAADLGRRNGVELLCTLPAEDSLYRWYGDMLSLRCQSTRTSYTAPELPEAAPVTAEEYLAAREAILRDLPHVLPNAAVMSFQQKLCEAYGGGLFRFSDGFFCAYRKEDHWFVPELLLSDPALSVPALFSPVTGPYLCSDLPFPDGFIWNLTLD